MKKTIISALSVIIVIAFVTIFAIFMNLNDPKEANVNSVEMSYEPDQSIPVESVVKEEYLYTMKRFEDIIGIFKKGEDTPFMTIDVLVDSLPQYDTEALEEGIGVKSDEELQKLIEDYES